MGRGTRSLPVPKVARASLAPPLLVALLLATPSSAVNVDWVTVGNPGNTANSTGLGAVAYTYQIGKYEVTNSQYAEFLNAVAKTDPYLLYDLFMGSEPPGGIMRSGSSGNYSYSVKSGFENKPVNYVSYFDALRFANWLNNGQGNGDTESGAYTLLGGTSYPSNATTVMRNAGASIFLTNENEWYKSALFNGLIYFHYPAGSNALMTCETPGDTANAANCWNAVGTVTDVGAYTGSPSPYGTYDQGGNLSEWVEDFGSAGSTMNRGVRGGDFRSLAGEMGGRSQASPGLAFSDAGFRVASSVVPEPGTGVLVMMGLLGPAFRRRRQVRGG